MSDLSEVPIALEAKLQAIVMVLGGISNKRDIMPTHICEAGLRVNTGQVPLIAGWWETLEGQDTHPDPQVEPRLVQGDLLDL